VNRDSEHRGGALLTLPWRAGRFENRLGCPAKSTPVVQLFGTITISTRRFFSRPSSVSLSRWAASRRSTPPRSEGRHERRRRARAKESGSRMTSRCYRCARRCGPSPPERNESWPPRRTADRADRIDVGAGPLSSAVLLQVRQLHVRTGPTSIHVRPSREISTSVSSTAGLSKETTSSANERLPRGKRTTL